MFVEFNHFSIELTKRDALDMAIPGCDNEPYVRQLLPKYRRQLEKIGNDKIVAELKEYGAWDDSELEDQEMNMVRILWLAAHDIYDRE